MDSLRKSQTPKILPLAREPVRYSPQRPLVSDTQVVFPSHLISREPFQARPRHRWQRIFIIILSTFFFLALSAIAFLLYKSFSVGRSIQLQNNPQATFLSDMKRFASSLITTDQHSLSGEQRGRINILLLGRAGEHYPGKNLTDTVIVMSIDTLNKKVSLLSLPRDLYAPIPSTLLYTKINSLYQYGLSNSQGVSPLRSSVETITGQSIDYFFVLDFDGFEKVIDALGGISVDVVRDFFDERYPGKNYSYETFEIHKGWQTLDGRTALKYVRERHNDPQGDFGRAKRQQQVLQAIKDKTFSLGTFFNIFAINDVLTALGESVQTNMSLDDMEEFLRLVKSMDTKNVTSIVVDAWKKESLLRVSHIQVGPTTAFILVPRVGNWNEIQDVSENIFQLDTIKARKDNIQKEDSSLTILFVPKDALIAEKMRRYVTEELGFSKVSLIPATALKNRPEESMIVDRTRLEKPYSLDELLRTFSLQKEQTLPLLDPQKDASDFVITIGKNLAETLSFDEQLSSEAPWDTSFSDVLTPQLLKRQRE